MPGSSAGDDLEFKASGRLITIVPKVDRASKPSPEKRRLDRGIEESLKEFKSGKFAGPFATAEEFLADLHTESAKLGASASKNTKRARD